jgi:hypothetical protein
MPIPAGVSATRAAARCRKRRFTRLRVTAFPTAPLTTKPMRGPSSRSTAWTTSVGRLARTPRRVVRWKSFERRIRNDRGNTVVGRPGQADSRVRPLRRRAEMMARPARVRIRRRKPWVRLRRRLLGWNVRLLTGKLTNLRSGRQSGTVLTRHASQAGRAGGSGRYGSDLLTVRGTAKPVKPMRTEPMRTRPTHLGGIEKCQLRASDIADCRCSRRRSAGGDGATTLFRSVSSDEDGGNAANIAASGVSNRTELSSGHAEQHGEYRRLACTATLRLLASRFASQFSLSFGSWRSVKQVAGAFMHTLWISVWKQRRSTSPVCRRRNATVQTTADLCFAFPS